MAKDVGQTVSFDYDRHTDVLHVTFGTGEPSFSEEINDLLVVDFGIYTGTPTGLQILQVKEAGMDPREIFRKSVPKILERQRAMNKAVSAEREQMLKQALDSIPGKLKEAVPA